MATFYDELQTLKAEADKAFTLWERDHIMFSNNFLVALRTGLGWPEQAFRRTEFRRDGIPKDARFGPGGFTDPKGYRFGVLISHGRGFIEWLYSCRRRDDAAFDVSIDDDTWRIDLDDPSTMGPVIEDMKKALREHIVLDAYPALTGFKAQGG